MNFLPIIIIFLIFGFVFYYKKNEKQEKNIEKNIEVDEMSELTKKLRYQTNSGTSGAITLYTTAAEAGNNYINLQVDGSNVYAALGATSDSNASHMRVQKNGTTYAILTKKAPDAVVTKTLVGIHDLVATTMPWYDDDGNQINKRVYASPDGKFYLDPDGGLYVSNDLMETTYSEEIGGVQNILWMTAEVNGRNILNNNGFDTYVQVWQVEEDELHENYWAGETPSMTSADRNSNLVRLNITSFSEN